MLGLFKVFVDLLIEMLVIRLIFFEGIIFVLENESDLDFYNAFSYCFNNGKIVG